jgi:tritrans,polycis-undecaprenyl-diphosphate synthase [geranylgeranyl-diphosphate specific]
MGISESISGMLTNTAYSKYEEKLEKEVLGEGGPVPKHVAIIMDGNRRYAQEVLRSGDPNEGHVKGKEKMEEVLDWCFRTKIRVLTVYAFSTENFSREEGEVDFILELIKESLNEFADDERIHKNRVRIRMIGDRSMLPSDFLAAVDNAEGKTKDYDDYHLNMAVAYGGRQEIVSAVKEVAKKVKNGEMSVDDITEESLSCQMYTSDDPDPDLVLRTSGELRLSNFLLWQLAYSELYFTDIYWPGFRYIDFLRAIRSYQQRTRRYGK